MNSIITPKSVTFSNQQLRAIQPLIPAHLEVDC